MIVFCGQSCVAINFSEITFPLLNIKYYTWDNFKVESDFIVQNQKLDSLPLVNTANKFFATSNLNRWFKFCMDL